MVMDVLFLLIGSLGKYFLRYYVNIFFLFLLVVVVFIGGIFFFFLDWYFWMMLVKIFFGIFKFKNDFIFLISLK